MLDVYFYGVKCDFPAKQVCRRVHYRNYSQRLIGLLWEIHVTSCGIIRRNCQWYLPFIVTSKVLQRTLWPFIYGSYWRMQVLTTVSTFLFRIREAIPAILLKRTSVFRPKHFGAQKKHPATTVNTKQQNPSKHVTTNTCCHTFLLKQSLELINLPAL
jgi:hypothetical protein